MNRTPQQFYDDLARWEGYLSPEQKAAMLQQYIATELTNTLSARITEAISGLQCGIDITAHYEPTTGLTLSLKQQESEPVEEEPEPEPTEVELDPEVEHSSFSMKDGQKIQRSSPTDLAVHFPDGTTIALPRATDTLVKFVKKVGVEKVRRVVEEKGLVFCKIPVISNRRDPKYGKTQHDLGNGWLLITHSNNRMKRSFIETVSDALGLGVTVDML